MLSSSPDHPLRLWSLGSGPLPQRLVARGNILALASHTNAHAEATPALWAAGIGRNGVCLWNVEQGRCSTRLPIKAERVRALAISPDGARLAIAGSQGLLQVWDTAALIPVHILTGHSDEVRSLAFDETGTRLYSTGKDRQLILWDLTSGVALATAKLAGAGLALTRSPEGQVVVGTAQGALEFFNAQLSVAGDPLPLHDDWVMDIARSGEHLVTAGGDGKVVVWSFATQRIEHVLAGHVGRVVSVRASPDGRWVATSGEDRSVRIWATTDWSLAARLDDHQGTVRALSFVPKSSTLISAGDDRTMRFWDLSRMEDAGQNVLQHTQTSYRVRLEGTEVEPN